MYIFDCLSVLFRALFLLSFLNLPAWNPDSLKQAAALLAHDSERVNLFYTEGFAKRALDPAYSFFCAREALHYSGANGMERHRARAHNLMGILYYRHGRLSEALKQHRLALALREALGDEKGLAQSYTNLGNVYSDMGLKALAKDVYLKALQSNTRLGDFKQVDNCLLNLAVLSTELGSLTEAEHQFRLCLSRAKKRFDYELEALCLNNLSVIYIKQGLADQAIECAENSLKVKTLMDNEMEKADSYLNLARAYLMKNDLDLAGQNLQAAMQQINAFGYFDAALQAKPILADFYAAGGDAAKAYAELRRYLAMRDSLDQSHVAESEEALYECESQLAKPYTAPQFPYLYLVFLLGPALLAIMWVVRQSR